jgi:nitrate/TMAO reductase-like tetraheme cytochrome c subunit
MMNIHSVAAGNKLKKDKFIISAVIAVSVIVLSAFWSITQIHAASTPNFRASCKHVRQMMPGERHG